jgi:single-strand selective monofunctional uracil DNA glycosylase
VVEAQVSAAGLVGAARDLAAEAGALAFGPAVSHVYNPLQYAWPLHELYLRRFGKGTKRVVFVGMNPGPFGMAQTGVPFGEVAVVRDWMGLRAPVAKPRSEHPKRPVLGLDCPRSEVSGKRLWGLFAQRFGTPEKFFREHFVVNYCPLAFLDDGGRNLTPDKFSAHESAALFAACDRHLLRVFEILEPSWIVGVGGFAFARVEMVAGSVAAKRAQVLHPSPASPAANRDWAGAATKQLRAAGIW